MKFRLIDLVIPRLQKRSILPLLAMGAAGALLGGVYGIVHDQITFSLGYEYFTRYKFYQFADAHREDASDREFVGTIGFLATWWVGGLVAWVIGRVSLLRESRLPPISEMVRAFGIAFAGSGLSAIFGWCWGQWRRTTGHGEAWLAWMESLGVVDQDAFMTVGYIHNSSYVGGVVGTVAALWYLNRCPKRRSAASSVGER